MMHWVLKPWSKMPMVTSLQDVCFHGVKIRGSFLPASCHILWMEWENAAWTGWTRRACVTFWWRITRKISQWPRFWGKLGSLRYHWPWCDRPPIQLLGNFSKIQRDCRLYDLRWSINVNGLFCVALIWLSRAGKHRESLERLAAAVASVQRPEVEVPCLHEANRVFVLSWEVSTCLERELLHDGWHIESDISMTLAQLSSDWDMLHVAISYSTRLLFLLRPEWKKHQNIEQTILNLHTRVKIVLMRQ